MKTLNIFWLLMLIAFCSVAQKADNSLLHKGNEAYKRKLYDQAETLYQNALTQNPDNLTAAFNLGNTLFRNKKVENATQLYDEALTFAKDDAQKGNASYNKGVSLTQQKKLPESINAYKDALRFNPLDTLARENLQRALNEQKKKQDEENKKNKDNPPPKNDKEKGQDKLNPQQIKQMLQALQEQEKQLQKKVQSSKANSLSKPEKDW
jgi:Ca-activated chloride channel family protein